MTDQLTHNQNKSEHLTSAGIIVSGRVVKVIFQKPDDDYYIFTMLPAGASQAIKVKGYAVEVKPGMELGCLGQWEDNAKFGSTFSALNVSELLPNTVEGIRAYLYGGVIKDLSKTNADDLIKWFGRKLFDTAEQFPERLKEVSGVPRARLIELSRVVKEKRAIPRIMTYLSELGLSRNLAHKVFKEFGVEAVTVIGTNPYELMRIPKIGFLESDRIALSLGVDLHSSTRISASMQAVLVRESGRGSTAMQRNDLLKCMLEALAYNGTSVEQRKVEATLIAELARKTKVMLRTINGVEYVSSTEQYAAEVRIAKSVLSLYSASNSKKIKSAHLSSKRFSHLDRDQISAARMALDSNFSIITGRPGCGKTTVTKSIVEVLQESGLTVLLCAPTGRAAKRIKEATGFAGSTIHRMLGSKGPDGFEHDADNFLNCDAIILDEASMLGTSLMDSLLQAIAPGTKVILVGDKDQLASIEAGNILADLIRSATVSTYTLTEPHRFAKNSAIVTNSHLIIDGSLPRKNNDSDFRMHETKDDAEILSTILKQYQHCLSAGFDPQDIQVLTPMRKVTDLGSNNINRILKQHINPGNPTNSISKNRFGETVTFSVGDRVMQCSNNYDLNVFNGDIGYIKSIDKSGIIIDFSGDVARYSKTDLDDLELAYASTIHKSQGCEYKAVIIPFCKSHANMLDRNLLYTAVTRGKKYVSIVGDLWMMKRIVEKTNSATRITGLEQCLWDEFDRFRSTHKLRRVSALDSSYSLN